MDREEAGRARVGNLRRRATTGPGPADKNCAARVEFRVLTLQGVRLLEEALGGHGKKLGAVRRSIVVQQGDLVAAGPVQQTQICRLGDAIPELLLLLVGQWRRPVYVAIESVHIVGKLVEDKVPAIALVAAAGQHVWPGKDDGTPVPRLAVYAPRRMRPPRLCSQGGCW